MTAIGVISNSAITLKIIQRFFEKNLGEEMHTTAL